MQKSKVIKLTKGELNELLKTITEEMPNYGLILKLQYIYGRNVSEVYRLRKQDIDQDENKITFIMNGDKLVYDVHEEIKEQLYNTIAESRKQYIFQEAERPLSNVKDNINYYLHKKSESLNDLEFLEGIRLTTKDFKALRGQHLYQEGITIKTIHELYHNTNMDGTKKTICYEELKEELFPDDIDEIINQTSFNVFTEHSFNNNPLFYVTGEEDLDCIVEIDEDVGTINFYGEDSLKELFESFDSVDLITKLSQVQCAGDYIYYNSLKFLRN